MINITGGLTVLVLTLLTFSVVSAAFKKTDVLSETDSKRFNDEREVVALLTELIHAAGQRVEADNIYGIGERFVAGNKAQDNIINISTKIKQLLP